MATLRLPDVDLSGEEHTNGLLQQEEHKKKLEAGRLAQKVYLMSHGMEFSAVHDVQGKHKNQKSMETALIMENMYEVLQMKRKEQDKLFETLNINPSAGAPEDYLEEVLQLMKRVESAARLAHRAANTNGMYAFCLVPNADVPAADATSVDARSILSAEEVLFKRKPVGGRALSSGELLWKLPESASTGPVKKSGGCAVPDEYMELASCTRYSCEFGRENHGDVSEGEEGETSDCPGKGILARVTFPGKGRAAHMEERHPDCPLNGTTHSNRRKAFRSATCDFAVDHTSLDPYRTKLPCGCVQLTVLSVSLHGHSLLHGYNPSAAPALAIRQAHEKAYAADPSCGHFQGMGRPVYENYVLPVAQAVEEHAAEVVSRMRGFALAMSPSPSLAQDIADVCDVLAHTWPIGGAVLSAGRRLTSLFPRRSSPGTLQVLKGHVHDLSQLGHKVVHLGLVPDAPDPPQPAEVAFAAAANLVVPQLGAPPTEEALASAAAARQHVLDNTTASRTISTAQEGEQQADHPLFIAVALRGAEDFLQDRRDTGFGVDSTFKISSNDDKLITLSTLDEYNAVVPLGFAVCDSESAENIDRLMRLCIPDGFTPKFMVSDMALAIRKSVESMWPGMSVVPTFRRLCTWHVHRRVNATFAAYPEIGQAFKDVRDSGSILAYDAGLMAIFLGLGVARVTSCDVEVSAATGCELGGVISSLLSDLVIASVTAGTGVETEAETETAEVAAEVEVGVGGMEDETEDETEEGGEDVEEGGAEVAAVEGGGDGGDRRSRGRLGFGHAFPLNENGEEGGECSRESDAVVAAVLRDEDRRLMEDEVETQVETTVETEEGERAAEMAPLMAPFSGALEIALEEQREEEVAETVEDVFGDVVSSLEHGLGEEDAEEELLAEAEEMALPAAVDDDDDDGEEGVISADEHAARITLKNLIRRAESGRSTADPAASSSISSENLLDVGLSWLSGPAIRALDVVSDTLSEQLPTYTLKIQEFNNGLKETLKNAAEDCLAGRIDREQNEAVRSSVVQSVFSLAFGDVVGERVMQAAGDLAVMFRVFMDRTASRPPLDWRKLYRMLARYDTDRERWALPFLEDDTRCRANSPAESHHNLLKVVHRIGRLVKRLDRVFVRLVAVHAELLQAHRVRTMERVNSLFRIITDKTCVSETAVTYVHNYLLQSVVVRTDGNVLPGEEVGEEEEQQAVDVRLGDVVSVHGRLMRSTSRQRRGFTYSFCSNPMFLALVAGGASTVYLSLSSVGFCSQEEISLTENMVKPMPGVLEGRGWWVTLAGVRYTVKWNPKGNRVCDCYYHRRTSACCKHVFLVARFEASRRVQGPVLHAPPEGEEAQWRPRVDLWSAQADVPTNGIEFAQLVRSMSETFRALGLLKRHVLRTDFMSLVRLKRSQTSLAGAPSAGDSNMIERVLMAARSRSGSTRVNAPNDAPPAPPPMPPPSAPLSPAQSSPRSSPAPHSASTIFDMSQLGPPAHAPIQVGDEIIEFFNTMIAPAVDRVERQQRNPSDNDLIRRLENACRNHRSARMNEAIQDRQRRQRRDAGRVRETAILRARGREERERRGERQSESRRAHGGAPASAGASATAPNERRRGTGRRPHGGPLLLHHFASLLSSTSTSSASTSSTSTSSTSTSSTSTSSTSTSSAASEVASPNKRGRSPSDGSLDAPSDTPVDAPSSNSLSSPTLRSPKRRRNLRSQTVTTPPQ